MSVLIDYLGVFCKTIPVLGDFFGGFYFYRS